MRIEMFVPPAFTPRPLDLEHLVQVTGKRWYYAPFGRVALYRILERKRPDKILIPVYICASVLEPLQRLGIEPIFYDLDPHDLNASAESILFLSEKYQVKTVLVASIYGNPADLIQISELCRQNGIFMIDDAAQSFGATLEGKMVGTFGDAGFFSFSPGKPTAGHMGSFFWTGHEVKQGEKSDFLYHYLKWKDFELNRLKIYARKPYRKFFNYLFRLYNRLSDPYTEQRMFPFENRILGGILHDVLAGNFDFRTRYATLFRKSVKENGYFRVLRAQRGISAEHKIVLIFYEEAVLQKFRRYLAEKGIFSMEGYRMLAQNPRYLKNAHMVENRILELPIENDAQKMEYMIEKVVDFVRH